MDPQQLAGVANIVYAILLILGGVAGYGQAKSKASLVSGVAAGVVVLVAAIGIFTDQRWGLMLGALAALVLLAFFIYRYAKTQKFYPALVMLVVSIVALAVDIWSLYLTGQGTGG